MKKLLMLLFIPLLASTAASASTSLSIPAHSAWASADASCVASPKGGLMSRGANQSGCVLAIPVPLSDAHVIKQITIYYGMNTTHAVDITASLRYKSLDETSSVVPVDQATNDVWLGTNLIGNTSTIYYANLMSQTSLPVTYPDAFPVDSWKGYYVLVTLDDHWPAEFYGMKILYD